MKTRTLKLSATWDPNFGSSPLPSSIGGYHWSRSILAAWWMLSSEPHLAISHGYLILWLPCVCNARNHWLFLLCLKVESKFKNSVASNKWGLCIDATFSQWSSWALYWSLAIRDWLSLHPPMSPVWHKASRVHWWRIGGCQWLRLLLITSPYLSSFIKSGQTWVLCVRKSDPSVSERGELTAMGSIWPELHSTAAEHFNRNPFLNCRPVMGKGEADN